MKHHFPRHFHFPRRFTVFFENGNTWKFLDKKYQHTNRTSSTPSTYIPSKRLRNSKGTSAPKVLVSIFQYRNMTNDFILKQFPNSSFENIFIGTYRRSWIKITSTPISNHLPHETITLLFLLYNLLAIHHPLEQQ